MDSMYVEQYLSCVVRVELTDHSCSSSTHKSTEASTLGMARIHRYLQRQPPCRTSSASLLPLRRYRSS
jgi:hypothetical protein